MSNGDEIAEFEFKDGGVCSHRNVALVAVYVKGKKHGIPLHKIRDWIETQNGPVVVNKEPLDDPWKHRTSGMRCRTCMWSVMKDPNPREYPQPGLLAGKRVGRCRRHAPTMGGYPVIYEDDWCGDHRVDENKVP